MNASKIIGLLAIAGGATAIGWYFVKGKPPECTEGDTKCVGYDLYTCVNGEWKLTEENSPTCGYTEPCTEGETKCQGAAPPGAQYESICHLCRNGEWASVGTCDTDKNILGKLWWDDGVSPNFQAGSNHIAHLRIVNNTSKDLMVRVAVILTVIATNTPLPAGGEICLDHQFTVQNMPGSHACAIILQEENTGEQWVMYGEDLVIY